MDHDCAVKLTWNDFTSDITEACQLSRNLECFTDVTFIAQNRKLAAHRIILSASSKFFKTILSDIPCCVNPTIILSNIDFEDLEAIVDFMYTGVISVPPEKLSSLLEAAACLQIDNLIKIENNACNEEENSYESENDQSFTYGEDLPLNDTKYIDINTDCISQVTNSNVDADNRDHNIMSTDEESLFHNQYTAYAEPGPKDNKYVTINLNSRINEFFQNNVYDQDVGRNSVGFCSMKGENKSHEKRIEDAVNEVIGGIGVKTAARKYNVAGNAITRKLQEKISSGLLPIRFNRRQKIKDPFIREKIMNAIKNGQSLGYLAKKFNVSRQGISYYKKRLVEEGMVDARELASLQKETKRKR